MASGGATVDDRLGLARTYDGLSGVLGGPENMEYARKALEIHEALLAADPSNHKADGWSATLNSGWVVRPAVRPGSFTIVREK